MNYGLLCDARGCPVSVSIFDGNTGDPKTLLPQVEKLKKDFGLASLVMVGDRGMISNVQIDASCGTHAERDADDGRHRLDHGAEKRRHRQACRRRRVAA